MVEIDKEKTKKILVEELGHTPEKVEKALEDYPQLDDIFKPAVEQWMKDRTFSDMEVDGLSLKEVVDNTQLAFPVAIRKLNKLFDENLSEEERTRLHKTLTQKVTFE